ncbi:MAG: ChbG/HpnK family deacetylase [Elusimicrobiota bacterium]
MIPRQLIVNADDFGASLAVNDAVVSAFQTGILRFASLMVDGPAAADAAAQAQANPGLGVGVHLVLCAEAPAAWGLRLLWDREERRRLEDSLSGQLERFLAWGLKPSHVDSHMNVHVHPAVFPILVRVAKRFGVSRLRWPGGELPASLGYQAEAGGAAAPAILPQLAVSAAYWALGLALKGSARDLELTRSFGMLHSGMMTEDYLLWLLRRLPEGRTEIYFHPTTEPGSEMSGRPTRTHRTVTELRSLLSPRVRQAIREAGIELLSARP